MEGEQKDIDSKQFVKLLIDNDNNSWKLFYYNYRKLILSTITRITQRFSSCITPEDIEEIFGNVILNLLANNREKLKMFDPAKGYKFSSWITLITINTTYDYLRKIARISAKTESLSSYPYAVEIHGNEKLPFEYVEKMELLKRVDDYFMSLSEKDKAFVYLYYRLNLNPRKIASILGISVKTVYTKKHKITLRILSLLKDTIT